MNSPFMQYTQIHRMPTLKCQTVICVNLLQGRDNRDHVRIQSWHIISNQGPGFNYRVCPTIAQVGVGALNAYTEKSCAELVLK